METTVLRYRGRAVSAAEVEYIRHLIATRPGLTRCRLSQEVCTVWNWRQENGLLREMVCRGLLLALDRAGHIALPAQKVRPANPLAKRVAPQAVEIDTSPIEATLEELGEIEVRQVRRTADEPLFNAMLEQYHYLKYSQPVGESLKFLFLARGRPVALFAWASAARHLGPRDQYLGWSSEQRRANIRFIVYNTRYLIPGWVRVPHLASHVLARMTRMLSGEWERVYRHPVYFAETFVDPTRHRGTCYRAANWVYLGRTTGRGKADQTHRPNRSLKEVLGLPLVDNFRTKLHAV
jgi:hypothetical protein